MNKYERLNQAVDIREAAVRCLTASQILMMGIRSPESQATEDSELVRDLEDAARFVLARARRYRTTVLQS